MAAAVPYAIGAQVALPDRQVVAFVGDGALSMLLGDLATLAQHLLQVKVVVVDNSSIGLILWEQMAFLGRWPWRRPARLACRRSRPRQSHA